MSTADTSHLPFQKFSFTLIRGRQPRVLLRMSAAEEGSYELHVLKGSAANPLTQFTRIVPFEVAERLNQGLQSAGVLGWEEEYGDDPARESLRWTLSIVFKEGVFALTSKGGSSVPAGFDELLEELYRIDFPRPAQSGPSDGIRQRVLSDIGGFDYAQLAGAMEAGGLDGLDASQMVNLLSEARSNPRALQERMREEFRRMPPDQQERMLDALASSGMASRAWWERFLRG